jgi:hypothetical protein
MTTRGVDYAITQAPAVASCLRANGYAFVIRYVDDSRNTSAKCIDRAEALTLLDAGLEIFLVYETRDGAPGFLPAGAAYYTSSQGAYDGAQARISAQGAGAPPATPIYAAVDFDAQESDLERMGDYFVEFVDGLGEYAAGVYGSYRVCAWARARGIAHLWQTAAWSDGALLDGVDLYQFQNGVTVCGVEVDLDEAFVTGWRKDVTEDEVRAIVRDELAKYGLTDQFKIPSVLTQLDQLAHHGHRIGEPDPAIRP